jgi:hypothetical protein
MESRDAMKLRAGVGIGVIAAFLAALALASAPQLHEYLHKSQRQHECAATIVASGNYHHAAPSPILPAKPVAPSAHSFTQQNSELIFAVVSSSVLEHAPPSVI